jgi:predicted short-subunit dehydrogenase-like oxidoreductase (DUF2520 family)
MKSLAIIGAGRVGRSLAALWHESGVMSVVGVCNRTQQSAREAVSEIGAGEAVARIGELPVADVYLLATPDNNVEAACRELACSHDLSSAVVFHVSGSLSSSVLSAARASGATVASVHPVMTFTDALTPAERFRGTYCGHEGDAGATQFLIEVFGAIGGRPFAIDSSAKPLYHAAMVFAMNYFVVTVDAGLQCLAEAGVDRQTGQAVLGPLLRAAASNIGELGPVEALTGPIARGDVGTVQSHLEALDQWDGGLAALYRALGRQAIALSEQAGRAPHEQLATLTRLLDE